MAMKKRVYQKRRTKLLKQIKDGVREYYCIMIKIVKGQYKDGRVPIQC